MFRIRTILSFLVLTVTPLMIRSAKADSINLLHVDIPEAQFEGFPETVALSFDWNVPTGNISDVVLNVNGPMTGFTPSGSVGFGSRGGITIMNFCDAGCLNLLQLFEPEMGSLPEILPQPGTYPVKWTLIGNVHPGCAHCLVDAVTTATVTTVPEPSTATLTWVALAGAGGLLSRSWKSLRRTTRS